MRNPFWPKHSMVFKGGPVGQQSTPVRTAGTAPPPTETNTEVVQAKRDARRQAQKRRGIQSTILAGETGGYKSEESKKPAKTLLGGGG